MILISQWFKFHVINSQLIYFCIGLSEIATQMGTVFECPNSLNPFSPNDESSKFNNCNTQQHFYKTIDLIACEVHNRLNSLEHGLFIVDDRCTICTFVRFVICVTQFNWQFLAINS